jgi:hypothetical protein
MNRFSFSIKKKIRPTIQIYERAAARFGSRPSPDFCPEVEGGGFCMLISWMI